MSEVKVPDIGDFTDVPVIEVLVVAGATVAVDDPLIVLESDKATMEVPSPAAGVVGEVAVKAGDTVTMGDLILTLSANGAAPQTPAPVVEPAPTVSSPAADAAPAPVAAAPAPTPPASDAVYAGPAARRLARERGIALGEVTGTGPKGRITKQDVAAFAPGSRGPRGPAVAGLPAWPTVDHASFGEIEVVELTRIQRLAGPALTRNWVTIPHVTQFDEADITDLEAFRKQTNETHAKDGVKLTMVSLLLKACASALREFPNVNSSLEGDTLVRKRYFHLGFAADTPQGLLVPVIRDVDKKGLLEIARELTELSTAARDGKLSREQMTGGTFTISSLGGIGGTAFTPIINAPEVAILGVSRSAMKPVWNGSEFAPRLMLPLSLSYDHRVIDGATAARFTTHLAGLLAAPLQMLL